MKIVLTFLFAILVGSLAVAQNTYVSSQTRPVDQLPPAFSTRLAQIVLLLNENGQQNCTAFRITPDGYYMTALHCVRDCLLSFNLAERGASPALGLAELIVVKNPNRVNTACPNLDLNGNQTSIQIVATGSALSTYNETFTTDYPQYFAALQTQGWGAHGNDFALLKVATPTSLPCLKLNLSPIGAYQSLFAVGFPIVALAASGGPAALPAMASTSGQVFAQSQDSQTYQAASGADAKNWILAQTSGRDIFFANAAIDSGQSGGPVLSPDGQVIGLVSGFMESTDGIASRDHELIGDRLGGAQGVFAKLPTNLAKTILEQNQKCQ